MKNKAVFLILTAMIFGQPKAYGATTKEKCGIPNYKDGPKWYDSAVCIVKALCPKCEEVTAKDITPGSHLFTNEHDQVVSFNVKFKRPIQIDGVNYPNLIHVALDPLNPGLIAHINAQKPGFTFKADGLEYRGGTIKYNKNGERLKIKVRYELAKFLGKTKFHVTSTMENGSKEADVTDVKISENMKRCGLTIPAGSTLSYMGTTVNELIVKPSKTMTVNGITIRPTHHFVIMQGEVCDPYAVDEEEAKKEGWGT